MDKKSSYINTSYYTVSASEIPARYVCSSPRITVQSTAQSFLLYSLTQSSSGGSSTDMTGDLSSKVPPTPFFFPPNISKAQARDLKQLQSHSASHGSMRLNRSSVITVIHTSRWTPGPYLYPPCSVATCERRRAPRKRSATWPQWVTQNCNTSLHIVVVISDTRSIMTVNRA